MFLVGETEAESLILDVDDVRYYIRTEDGEVHWRPAPADDVYVVTDGRQLALIDRELVSHTLSVITDVAIVITDIEESEPHLFYSDGEEDV